MSWWKSLKGKVRLAEPLKEHTTFKIGGEAKFFIEPKDINDLRLLLSLTKRYKMPVYVMGRGSNILVNDRGLDGVVLRLNTPYFKGFSYKNGNLRVGSGVLLYKIVKFTKEHGLSGLESLVGIPGTVGGALAMNAGASGKVKSQKSPLSRQAGKIKSIGDLVKDVTVIDYNGKIRTFKKKEIGFGYRTSSLSKYIILSTCLRLTKENKEGVSQRIKEYMDYRENTQDCSRPSAGCVFKNPQGYSAGRLIDLCGLKGKRIGDACVSLKHANFILNLQDCRAADVLKLMDLIKDKVKERFNITLEPEIKIWK
jgi:UDP-N-acetylmuramate dehydrogenase